MTVSNGTSNNTSNKNNITRIKDKYPKVDPVAFYEMMTKRVIDLLKCGEQPGVIDFVIGLEIEIDDGHLADSFHEYLAPVRESKNVSFLAEIEQKVVVISDDREVDKVVAIGGLRLIHVACDNKARLSEDELLIEVRRIRVFEGADITIRDNSGLLAVDRALMRGYNEVVNYLNGPA